MTQTALTAKALELLEAGVSIKEISRTLYNTKGARCSQIVKAMREVEAKAS
jgi:hypothetical protein